jgi:trehalose 2-sulfotransferase
VTSYVVCATPRSGSTLLCDALSRTGVAGHPLEFFEAVPATGVPRRPADYLEGLYDREAFALVADAPPHEPPPYSDLRGITRYADHLERVRRWGTTSNGVFGAKIMWRQLVDLVGQTADIPPCGGLEPRALLRCLFDDPRVIWVRREDTVRQAVSLWRAMQTQSWRAETESPTGEPRYSFAALRHLVELLSADDAAWEECFAGAGAELMVVMYEELANDLERVMARTLAHIGLPAGGLESVPSMRRQADELSDAWVAAYARDAVELGKADRV